MTAPKPNAELAYKILDRIDADPESWKQDVWITRVDCGTAACLAGWACLLAGDLPYGADEDGEAEYVRVAWQDEGRYIPARAAELLGVEFDRKEQFGHPLFDPNNSREDLGRLVAVIFGPRPEPSGAIDDEIPTCRRCDMPNAVDAQTGICRMCEGEIRVAKMEPEPAQ